MQLRSGSVFVIDRTARTKSAFPYLSTSNRICWILSNTRVVIPMTKAAALTRKPVSHLTPEVTFNGDRYVLMTPNSQG